MRRAAPPPVAMLETSQRRRWRDADPFMPITTLLLIAFGLVAIYTADNRDLGPSSLVFHQALYVVVGLVLMVTLAAIDYRLLRSLAAPLYLGALLLIVLVIPFGTWSGGAKRWFDLRVVWLQPSEPGKIALIVALAAFVATRGVKMRSPINYVLTGLLAAIPAVLVFREPDLGTSLVFVAIWCGIIVASRTRLLYLLGSVLAAVPVVYLAWHYPRRHPIIQDYQKSRLIAFLDPSQDVQGQGFNILQARYAIGQAGLLGHRFSDTAHNDLQLLAVKTTDFAFAHAIGNFGFVGAVALFTLFMLLLWRYLRVARLARDDFGQLIAMGAAAMLFFQAFVNIGMNEGILPVTGIPLPFISYGGSPLITLLALQGILQSVLMHREKLTF